MVYYTIETDVAGRIKTPGTIEHIQELAGPGSTPVLRRNIYGALTVGTIDDPDFDPSVNPGWSANPVARAQGLRLTSLYAYDGKIYSGYGNWNTNGDKTAIVEHDIQTGEATVLWERNMTPGADTWATGYYGEAVENVLKFNGNLYVPHIDPLGFWDGGGYATNQGGTWHNVRLPGQAEHIFDMCQTSLGFWACGSRILPDQVHGTASVWFCPGTQIDESKWVERFDEPVIENSTVHNTSLRFYRLHPQADGSVIVSAKGNNAVTPNVTRKLTVDTMTVVTDGSYEDFRPLPKSVVVGPYKYSVSTTDSGVIVREGAV